MISDKQHSGTLKKLTGYLLPVILTLIFLFFAFKNIDLNKSIQLIVGTSLLWLMIYIVVFYLSHYVRALRWKVMINSVKSDSSILHLFGAVMVGYGVNCVIPRLGEIYRGLFVGRWENISRTSMLGTIIVERIIDIASFALASLISVYIFSGNLLDEISWLKPSLMIGFTSILIFIVLLIILVKFEKKFTSVIIMMVGKIVPKFSEKLTEVFSTLISGLSSIQSVRSVFTIIFLTSIMLILYALNSYFGFFMLGMENMGKVDFTMAWVFMTISAFGVIIPTPGGTGSYHIISIFVLSQLYKFSYEVSAAYALLTHLISYIIFIGSTIGLIYIINKIRESKGAEKENFFSVFNIDSSLQ